ncbi:MAG: rod shape-determining protein RodA [Pirellulales bacterium]|nr:rod shape-determining protein RodA [Pirellulales bacterium]
MPWSLVAAVVLLAGLGILGIARVEELENRTGLCWRQAVFAVMALTVMLAVTWPHYRFFWRISYGLFGTALVLLVIVLFCPPTRYAHRWIRFGPVGIQPSELAKVALVLALARYLMYRENYRRLRGLLAPLAISLVPILLILKEPDLGTALVFLPVVLTMLFVAGAKRRDLAVVLAAGVLILPLLWIQMSREQRSRITAWFDQPLPGARVSGDAYHLDQAKQVRALGGAWGSWIAGQPTEDPAAYRLPEAHTDFIFCILGERYGLPGMAVLLGLYAFAVLRMIRVGSATQEPFGRLAAYGVAALFAVEVTINTAMTVGLLPITGLALPLLSYGGSNLLAHALAVGVVLSVGLRPTFEAAGEPFRFRE